MDLSLEKDFYDDGLGLIHDLSLQIAYYQQLLETYKRDALTGFYRREKFKEYIQSAAHGKCAAVIFFDINGLKLVNDQYGHNAGDTLIQKAAGSILAFRTKQSEVFRIGGDEFAAVFLEMDAIEIENMILHWKEQLCEMNAEGIPCRIAYGAAFFGEDGVVFSDLLQTADKRMYENKRSLNQA